jgi:hypothetical protein
MVNFLFLPLKLIFIIIYLLISNFFLQIFYKNNIKKYIFINIYKMKNKRVGGNDEKDLFSHNRVESPYTYY